MIKKIKERNLFQKKYLEDVLSEMSADELSEFEEVLEFFSQTYSEDEIADSYLFLIDDFFNESKYFYENGATHYRYSTIKEVEEKVYANKEYMQKYMLGLQVSGYLWRNHRQILRFYRKCLEKMYGEGYLEIGPGHGQYFAECIKASRFKKYTAIDLSQTSLDLTRNYIKLKGLSADYELILDDATRHEFKGKFDGICLSEVLEHLESPSEMLDRIYELLSDEGLFYVNVPLNAPAKDHLYLFSSIDEIKDLFSRQGFVIVDDLAVTSDGRPLEKALRKKLTVNYAFLARKE